MATTVSARRQALAELARSRRAEGSAARNLRIAAVLVVALGIVGLLGLWLSGRWSTPRELLAVRTSVDEEIAKLRDASRSGQSFSSDTGSFRAVFESARQVPEAYRDQAREEIGRLFEAREMAEIDSFFALPPEQRAAELDRRITAEEERRKNWEAERSRRQAERGPGGPPQAVSAAPAATAGGPPAGTGRRDGTEEGRNVRRKQYLDKTSAESRARMTEYRRAKDQRRIQLGLEPRRW